MARKSTGPWFRESKNAWYVCHNGKQVSLGVKGEGSESDAIRAWHRLMASDTLPSLKPARKPADTLTVKELVDAFLTDAESRLKPPTMRLYRLHLAAFCTSLGGVKVDTLTPNHVARWLHSLPHGSTTKGMMLRSASACLGWGTANGMTPTNPAKDVPKPKAKSRSAEAVIADADHERMLALASDTFKPVLRVLHGTGCRPGEACRITAGNFDPVNSVVRLADHKADRTGKPRLIFLPPDVCELLKGQSVRFGTGALLRTGTGNPWNAQSINLQVRRLAKRCGFKAMPYGYRHGFATAALVQGVPDAHVAALLGHTSTAMLHRHYSHLTSQAQTLRDALGRVRG